MNRVRPSVLVASAEFWAPGALLALNRHLRLAPPAWRYDRLVEVLRHGRVRV